MLAATNPDSPILIGISGKRGSGKDTAFNIIEGWCNESGFLPARRAFADPLKHSFARIFFPDISLEDALTWCNKIKNTATITVADDISISAREAMQRYGYEAHRQLFGESFWIDQLLPEENWERNFVVRGEVADVCIITDVRYDNEASRIKNLGGFIWNIERELDNLDEHSSELGISKELIDLTVINNDMNSFVRQVRALAEFLIDKTISKI